MNLKQLTALSALFLLLLIVVPRSADHGYRVETIIDYEKGITVNYPKTGNEKLDRKILSFVATTIDDYNDGAGKNTLLTVSFDCYSSFFTVIRFQITNETTGIAETDIKQSYKYFATLTKKSSLPSAPVSTVVSAPQTDKTTESKKKYIALTFDDGPSNQTDEILDILNANGAKGTFCVLGAKVSSYPETVKRIKKDGHELANHTFSHKKLTSLTDGELKKEIQKTQEQIFNITGTYPSFLRPTYGAINSNVREQCNMPLLMWNKDTMDWKSRNSDYIYNQAISNLKDGDIILFHDIYPSTKDAIKKLMPYLKKNNYEAVTVSRLMELKKIKVINGKAYFSTGNNT